ncbi:MAG: toll/interleukin-1 receptor domain-containing protein [Clostridia bacterium]|nr:toll/interleukin-1 receptor domain-containing protein [Clostridia bacterium]
MYDAFISYRRKTGSAIAKLLREMLKAKGVTAFMDLDELHSGTFDDKILLAIKNSPAFVLVLSPNALDDCGKSGDWLTKEITAALDEGKNIIPVICEDFKCPEKWNDGVDERIKRLPNYNGAPLSYAYLDATINKVIEHMNENGGNFGIGKGGTGLSDIDSFFRNRMRDMESIKGVDLAFHAGSEWHENIDRLDIISDLADAGVKLRIIVNTPESAELLGKHMRHKRKRYTSFKESVLLWRDFESQYPNVEVRESDIPLLRIYYAFHMEKPEENAIRVKYYTYGNPKINRNFSQNFEPSDTHFDLYRTEFEFLWDAAADKQ